MQTLEETDWVLMMLVVDSDVPDVLLGATTAAHNGGARPSMRRLSLCKQGVDEEGRAQNREVCCLAGATVHAVGSYDVRIVPSWCGTSPKQELMMRAPTTEERSSWLSGPTLAALNIAPLS